MKKLYWAIVLALASTTTCALAQEYGPPQPPPDMRHYIYIEADANIEVSADLTKISISLSEKRKSSEEATKLVSDKISTFNQSLATLGVPESSIETKSFNFAKVYIILRDKKGEPVSTYVDPDRDRFDGYRATYDAIVTLGTTDKIGQVLSNASALGIEVDSVSFASSKEDDYVEQVRKLAADKARARAEVYASSLGGTLGNLLNVKEGNGYNPETMGYQSPDGYADLMAIDPYTTPMDIAPGKLTFRSSIAAKWELTAVK